jgi:hypothetical protein
MAGEDAAGAGRTSPLLRPPAQGSRSAARSSQSVEFTMKDIVLPVLSSSATAQELNEWFLTLEHNIRAAGAKEAFESQDVNSAAMWVANICATFVSTQAVLIDLSSPRPHA